MEPFFGEGGGGRVVVFDTTFNNISVILWWSVLLVKEPGVPRENHQPREFGVWLYIQSVVHFGTDFVVHTVLTKKSLAL